jgi:endonuclease YncB( thermonuclease family)
MNSMRILFFALLLVSASSHADTFTGMVIRVSEGDSMTVEDSATKAHLRVRLAGIDAPEPRQPFSDSSRRALGLLLLGEHVTVQWTKRDRYNRLLGKARLNGRDVALHQLEAGRAWYFSEHATELSPDEQRSYAEAEQTARKHQNGLWRHPSPVPPWQFKASTANKK